MDSVENSQKKTRFFLNHGLNRINHRNSDSHSIDYPALVHDNLQGDPGQLQI
jgi:hypothetical protein